MTDYIQAGVSLDMIAESYFPEGGQLPSTEAAKKKAKKEKSVIIYPSDNQLFIDIDNKEGYEIFVAQRKILEQYVKFEKVVENTSKTPGHRHITVTLGLTITPIQRILLQAVLGSDLKRELLGFLMTLNGETKPTLFLEPKKK